MINCKFTESKFFVPIVLTIISAVAVILRLIPFVMNGVEWTNLPDSLYELRLTEIPFDRIDNFTGSGYEVNWGIFYTLILCFAKLINILPVVPIILFVGVIIVTYFIGRRVNKTVGLVSAALIAVLNGSLFYRSLYGGIDHHIGEVFFSLLFVLCFLMTVDKKKIGWFVATCLSGLAMMLVMTNCFIFPALLTIFAIVCYFTRSNCEAVCRVNIFTNLFLALMMLIFRNTDNISIYYYGWALPVLFLGLALVNFIIWLVNKKVENRWIGLGIFAGLFVALIIAINLMGYGGELVNQFTPFTQSGISEMASYSPYLFICTFGFSILLMLVGIASFIKLFKDKELKLDYLFIATWFIVTLWLTICHCRWEYHFVIPAVLLMGVGVWYGIKWLKSLKNSKDLVVILKGVFVLSLLVSVVMCCVVGAELTNEDESKWQDVGNWLQENTPDQPYEENGQPTYRILSDWEFGHYIEVWGHRCPYSNPFQQNADSERMMITGENIPSDIKYVIITDEVFDSAYKSIQLFANVDTPLEESVMYNVYHNGESLYDKNGIKIFTIEEWRKFSV